MRMPHSSGPLQHHFRAYRPVLTATAALLLAIAGDAHAYVSAAVSQPDLERRRLDAVPVAPSPFASDLLSGQGRDSNNWQWRRHSIGCECWRWPECVGNCSANPLLKSQMAANLLLLARLPLPFVIVLPYQEKKKSHLSYNTSTASRRGTYSMQTKFWLHLLNQKVVRLDFVKSSIFGDQPNSYSTHYYQENKDGQVYAISSNKLDHCFYQGVVYDTGDTDKPSTDSYAAVDTCFGLRGLLRVWNQTYGILPLHCAICSPGQLPHVVFEHRPTPIVRDAHLPTFWQPTSILSLGAKRRGDTDKQRFSDDPSAYFLRLSVILDHDLFVSFDRKLEQSVHYVGSLVNQATKSFKDTPVHLRLVQSEVWTMENHIRLPGSATAASEQTSIKDVLNRLAVYSLDRSTSRLDPVLSRGESATAAPPRRSHRHPLRPRRTAEASREDVPPPRQHRLPTSTSTSLPATPSGFNQPNDLEVLLTLSQFAEQQQGVEYLAVPDSICTARSLAVIHVNVSETVYHVSRLLSLAIAEVLGVKLFPCPPRLNCDTFDLFSDGDEARIRLALTFRLADCLLLPHSAANAEAEATCGNGHLDRGEECDPGLLLPASADNGTRTKETRRHPLLPCCDPNTCLVDSGATCVHGECCHRCQLVSRGQLCRPARDQCDLPEFCTGTQRLCPADLYLENGTPCRSGVSIGGGGGSTGVAEAGGGDDRPADSSALCYHGMCPTRDSQCRLIWGVRARQADDYCFREHNARTEGACGVAGQPCQPEHATCGLLHCRGGETRPVAPEAQDGQPFLTYTEHHGQQFECKHLSLASSVRFVPEGASCDQLNNRYCFHQQCVSPDVLPHSKCPSTGSGHVELWSSDSNNNTTDGLCSNRGVCTNAGFCFCRLGWTGPACEVESPTSADQHVNGTAVSGLLLPLQDQQQQRLFDLNPRSLAVEPDMVARIWRYLDKAVAGRYGPWGGLRSQLGGDAPSLHSLLLARAFPSRPVMNTTTLVLILVSVVGVLFVCLLVFMLFYRHRPGFLHKIGSSGGSTRRCCLYSAARAPKRGWSSHNSSNRSEKSVGWYLFGRRSRGDNSADGTASLRLLEANCEETELDKVNSTGDLQRKKTVVMVDDRDPRLRRHSDHRKCKRRVGGAAATLADCRQDRRRHHRRRHHRRRREDDGLVKPGCHSDTEVTTTTTTSAVVVFRDSEPEEEEASLDRMIKFGSMPSYRDDKLRRQGRKSSQHQRQHSSAQQPTTSSAFAQPVGPPTVSSTCLLVSRTSPLSVTYQVMPPLSSGNGGSQIPDLCLPTGTTSSGYYTSGSLAHATASGGATRAAKLINKVGHSSGAAALCRKEVQQHCHHQQLQIKSPSMLSSRHNEPDLHSINSTHLDILLENSVRHPEKGILKNKSEGGGQVSVHAGKSTSVSTVPASTPAANSSGGHQQRRRGHHRRHSDLETGDYKNSCVRSASVCSDTGGRVARHRLGISSTSSSASTSPTGSSSTSSFTSSRSGSSSSTDSEKTGSRSSESTGNEGELRSSNPEVKSPVNGNPVATTGSSSRRQLKTSRRYFGGDEKNDHHRQNRSRHRSSSRHLDPSEDHAASASLTPSPPGRTLTDSRSSSFSFGRNPTMTTNTTTTTTTTTTTPTSSSLESSSGDTGHRHYRRRRGRRRNRGQKDGAGSHGGSSSSPLLAPTILCNAGQQTDEMSIINATGLIAGTAGALVSFDNNSSRPKLPGAAASGDDQSSNDLEEEEEDWEECNESACEECQVVKAGSQLPRPQGSHFRPVRGGDSDPVAPGLRSAVAQQQSSCSPAEYSSANQASVLASTPHPDAYQLCLSASPSGPAGMARRIPSAAVVVKSLPTRSAGGRQKSLVPLLSDMDGGQQKQHWLRARLRSNGTPPASKSSTVGIPGVGEAFGFAVSSVSPAGLRSPVGVCHNSSNDDHTGQHSDPEVDAHLTAAARQRRHYQLPSAAVAVAAPSTVFPPALRDGFGAMLRAPVPQQQGGLGEVFTPSDAMVPEEQGVGGGDDRINTTVYGQSLARRCHQPYEEVATDDYADASCSSFVSPRAPAVAPQQHHHQQQHIYYQHGILLVLPNSSSPVDAPDSGLVATPFTDEEEDRLSLDEVVNTAAEVGMPESSRGLEPGTCLARSTVSGGGAGAAWAWSGTQALKVTTAAAPANHQPQASGLLQSARRPVGGYQTGYLGAANPTGPASFTPVLLSPERFHCARAPNTNGDLEGGGSGSNYPLSAFRCGADTHRRLVAGPTGGLAGPTTTTSSTVSGAVPGYSAVLQAHPPHPADNFLMDAQSNAGTFNGDDGGSDTSSIPEPGCDLVQLAQLTSTSTGVISRLTGSRY